MVLESSQVLPWMKCAVKARTSRPRTRENELQNPASLREAGDGMQLGDAEEGKDKTSSLAKRVAEGGRYWLASCRYEGRPGGKRRR